MNNFYKKPVNNIVEQMNVNYENYQNKLNDLQKNEDKKVENSSENQNENTNNILNNPMLANLVGNNNIANLLPLLNGNNGLNLPNKNELIMKLLSNMNNGNPQAKTLTNKTNIDDLTKIDDYDFL